MDSLNLFSWGWYKRFVCGVKFCDVGNKDVKGIKGKRLEAIDGWGDLISPNYIIIIITFTLQFPLDSLKFQVVKVSNPYWTSKLE